MVTNKLLSLRVLAESAGCSSPPKEVKEARFGLQEWGHKSKLTSCNGPNLTPPRENDVSELIRGF